MLVFYFLNSLTKNTKDQPGWSNSDIWALLSFISVDILSGKAFLTLVVCLVVRNKSFGNSSSSKFFLFYINIVPVIFFDADFNLLNCLFATLTIASW